jgi:diacylglycerol kinase family enzyme
MSLLTGPAEEKPAIAKQVTAMIDGDACGVTPMNIQVVPNAVNVMVPKIKDKNETWDITR